MRRGNSFRRSSFSHANPLQKEFGPFAHKPPTEGRRNKNIQAIVSPPIRSKATSEERSNFVDAMTGYLKIPSAENCEVLYKAAFKLLLKSVGSDPKAAEIAARIGQDRELLVNLLNRLEEQLIGLDVSPQAWRKVRGAITRGAELARNSLNGSASSRDPRRRHSGRTVSFSERGDDSSDSESELDENNAFTSASRSRSATAEIDYRAADANNAQTGESSPETPAEDEDEQPPDLTALRSFVSAAVSIHNDARDKKDLRDSFDGFVSDHENRFSMARTESQSEADTDTTFGRSTVISDVVMSKVHRPGREGSNLPPGGIASEQEVCVIWDDEESEEDNEAFTRLAQDLEDVFQDNRELIENLVDDDDFEDYDDYEFDEEEAQESEELFKSEFHQGRFRYSSIKEELTPSEADVHKITCLEYDKNEEELVIVQFDDDGNELRRKHFAGRHSLSRVGSEDHHHRSDAEHRATSSDVHVRHADSDFGRRLYNVESAELTRVEYEKWIVRDNKVSLGGPLSLESQEIQAKRSRGSSLWEIHRDRITEGVNRITEGVRKVKKSRGAAKRNESDDVGVTETSPASLPERILTTDAFATAAKWKTSAQESGEQPLTAKVQEEGGSVATGASDELSLPQEVVRVTFPYQAPVKRIPSRGVEQEAEDMEHELPDQSVKPADKPGAHQCMGADKDSANEYLASHGIYDLFQFMMSNLIAKQPEEPIDYLINMTRTINTNLKIKANTSKAMRTGIGSKVKVP